MFFVKPLSRKGEAEDVIIHLITRLQRYFINHGNYKVKAIRTNNGGEFTSNTLKSFLESEGIIHQLTVPHHSNQNGVAEGAIRYVVEKTRRLLQSSGTPKGYAMLTAVYLINLLSSRTIDNKIPYSMFCVSSKSAPEIHPFGCRAFVNIPLAVRSTKLASTAHSGIFLGYDVQRRSYLIWIPRTGLIVTSSDVRFIDSEFPFLTDSSNCLPVRVRSGRISGASSMLSNNGGVIYLPPSTNFLPSSSTKSSHISESHVISDSPASEYSDIDMPLPGDLPSSPTLEFPQETVPECSSPFVDSDVLSTAAVSHDNSILQPSSHTAPNDVSTEYSIQSSNVDYSDPEFVPSRDISSVASPVWTQGASPRVDSEREVILESKHSENEKYIHPQNAIYVPTGSSSTCDHPSIIIERCLTYHDLSNKSVSDIVNPNYEATCTINGSRNREVSYAQAMASENKDKWLTAINAEMKAIMDNKTYEEVARSSVPKNTNIVDCRLVLTIKDDGRYKARLVARGYSQIEGIDYSETFAPVIRYESIRNALYIASQYGLQIHQMDVTTAFLNADLDTPIYMKPPKGDQSSSNPNIVWKLKKSLYGLKQAPLMWNKSIVKVLNQDGFQQNEAEKCLFFKGSNENMIIVALYIDDLLIMAKDLNVPTNFKRTIMNHFKMKDLGAVSKFLEMNIDIKRNNDNSVQVQLSLKDYIHKTLSEYGMSECNSVATPLDVNVEVLCQKHAGSYMTQLCNSLVANK